MIGLTDASLSFGALRLFEGLTLGVPQGRTTAILGPNGRGKTTLLRAMLGFQALDRGHRHAPAIIGYVPQHGASQAKLSGLEVVIMGRAARLGLFGQPGPEDVTAAHGALAQVGAENLAELRYDRMSGGQRQMILIARALATGSRVLVLDEPTSALDLGNQSRTLSLIASLGRIRDRAILFSTHDPNHALAVADYVVLMMPGGAVLQGPVDRMITPGLMAELYGVPMQWVRPADPSGRSAMLPAFTGKEAA
ncbi:ABC transporter ATP-binding protein [Roseicyclus marinus]|uniref:ABC transporter ATP-binding protein n=1 Tax=Roseicyclus marinus TaxID=2161673 RepID=UPI00240FBA69|nr:ABC transporter ATP-binding protein [Roseicyclus marinus]MDG3043004.1 ABC transporter ATP-binding protein [Roseicyclus marinus]